MNNSLIFLFFLCFLGLGNISMAQELRRAASGKDYDVVNIKGGQAVDSVYVKEVKVRGEGDAVYIVVPLDAIDSSVGDFFLLTKIETPLGEKLLPFRVNVHETADGYQVVNISQFAVKHGKLHFFSDEVLLFEVWPLSKDGQPEQ